MRRPFETLHARAFGPIGAEPVVVTAPARELAQRYAADVVLAAAVFRPNAEGLFEFGPRGFGTRQLLKARGVYAAERVVIAVTPLDVHAIAVLFRGRVRRPVWTAPRSQLVGYVVPAVGTSAAGSAFVLTLRHGRELAELLPCGCDEESARVHAMLVTGPGATTNP
jgi:hypothetical protein